MVFEMLGDVEVEVDRLCESLCQAVDGKLNKFWIRFVYDSCLVFRLISNDTCIGILNGYDTNI